jgi:predicted ATPase
LHHADTRIDAQLVDPDAEDVRADLYLVRGDQRICTVDQLSSGEVELSTIAGAVVLDELVDGLVLIDEPELHLHHEWQAGILPALRELVPKAQFIVATHSDTVWDRSPGYARFSLMPRRRGKS